jgi:hypothetical protein
MEKVAREFGRQICGGQRHPMWVDKRWIKIKQPLPGVSPAKSFGWEPIDRD